MSPVERDLISKLMQVNPNQRLGGGSYEDGLDFNGLRSHEFFKDINWETLFSDDLPFKTGIKVKEPSKPKGSGGVKKQGTGKSAGHKSSVHSNLSNEDPVQIQRKITVASLGRMGENDIVYEGMLKKTKYMRDQPRKFVLYANGELKYYKEGEDEERGVIKIKADTKLIKVKKNKMEITANGKSYNLVEMADNKFTIDHWID
jgi:hypothetical protein